MASTLDPEILFDMIGTDVPQDLKPNILIVGSLAAAYHFRDQLDRRGIATKDADVVVQPAGAIAECQQIAEQLFALDWRPTDGCYPLPEPGPNVRAVRLYPPKTTTYFIELLGLPEVSQTEAQTWVPFQLAKGWYGLPTFRFMGVTRFYQQTASNGLHYAAPAMMALSNLLSHPAVVGRFHRLRDRGALRAMVADGAG